MTRMTYSRKTLIPIFLMLLLGIVFVRSIVAQDSCSNEYKRIYFGQTTRDGINSSTPIKKYCFIGQEGDRIQIELKHQSGTLDPLLQLWDGADEQLLDNNDDRSLASKDARITYVLENDGAYIIYASRTGLEEGTTSGLYSLSLSRNQDDPIPSTKENTDTDEVKSKPQILTKTSSVDECPVLFDTIEFDETISGTITDEEYYFAYCFAGDKDDEVLIEMTATDGSLDPYLVLSDLRMDEIYQENDDVRFAQRDSRIIFILPETDTYLISVTRYDLEDGTSVGDFELSLRRNVDKAGFEDLLEPQSPPEYLCNHALLSQLNKTQWEDQETNFNFRLNFGCEGDAAVSVFGFMFLAPYEIEGQDVKLQLNGESYLLKITNRSLRLVSENQDHFVLQDVGQPLCNTTSLRELTEGVWYVGDEESIGFRVDFLCNGVAIINLDGTIEALAYEYNVRDETIILYLDDDELIWRDVFILPGNRLAIKDEDGGLVMKNVLLDYDSSDI